MEELRICRRCSNRKEDSEFASRSKIKNTGFCKSCDREKYREYYKRKNKNAVKREVLGTQTEVLIGSESKFIQDKEYYKTYYDKNRDRIRCRVSRYKEENKDKIAARSKLTRAIKKGTVSKEPCVACLIQHGITNWEVDGHHTNYDWPLNVIWLCRSHHGKVHS